MAITSESHGLVCFRYPDLREKSRTAVYTTVWNVLDYPACVIPVGSSVDPLLDAQKSRTSFYGDTDRKNWEYCKCTLSLIVDV